MPLSKLDKFYRAVLLSKYFVKGWGNPIGLKRLLEFRKVVSNRALCFELVSKNYPVKIDKDEEWSDCRIIEGHFFSPLAKYLPDLIPPESHNAYFQMILPKKWSSDFYKPICIHMAGTGDQYFWRRRQLIAKPLLREGNISSILLENPFYGLRKPRDQVRSILRNVSDIFVMGGCLILESLVLFHWCESQGYGPLGVTGMSMGGHMASLAATNWPKPIVVVPCLSWSTASGVFTEGVISGAINWKLLETQFNSDSVYKAEIMNMVNVIEDPAHQQLLSKLQPLVPQEHTNNMPCFSQSSDAFKAGQEFAKTYPTSMVHMDKPKEKTDIATSSLEPPVPPNIKAETVVSENLCSKTDLSTSDVNLKVSQISTDIPCNSTNITNNQSDTTELPVQSKEIADGKLISNIGGLFKFGFPNLSKLKLVNHDDRSNIMNSLKESETVKKSTNQSMNWREHEALHFMRGIMDECTHLRNFAKPVDTSLIIAVCAKDDGYVPREGVTNLTDIWPGAEVRYVDAGHVSAFLLHQKVFRTAIIDAFERAKLKYNIHPSN